MPALSTILQLVIAIIIVLVLFAIGFFVYNAELLKAIRTMGTNKQMVQVFKGVLDVGVLPNGTIQVYDTTNPSAPNYVDLTPAYNQMPGAGFTYNFWLYLDYERAPERFNDMLQNGVPTIKKQDTGLESTDYILLLRGDPTPKTYKNMCESENKTDILIKCPLIKLENGWDNLTVEFNTVSSPDAVNESAKKQCDNLNSSDWLTINNHKISVYGLRTGINAAKYNKRWFMVTVVIRDTSPEDPIPLRNKARCMIYVNGQKELDRYVDGEIDVRSGYASVLKQNSGNLYIGPKITFRQKINNTMIDKTTSAPLNTNTKINDSQKVVMADLSYYNHELDPIAISKLFSGGFSRTVAPTSVDPEKQDQSFLNNLSMASSRPELQYL